MSEYADRDCRRLGQLKSDRLPHESVWREVFDLMAPERVHGFNGGTVNASDAQAKRAEIYDSTAIDAGRIAASGFASGLHPANSIWFGLDVGQQSEQERQWLDNAARTIFKNVHAANFDAEMGEAYSDLIPAGWFVLYIDEAEQGGYHFEHWPLAECFIGSSKPGRGVDIIHREFELTVEQLVGQYGLDNVSSQVREKYNQGGPALGEKIRVLWVIEPRPVHVPRERPPVVVVNEGPLVLVETQRDLRDLKLPFEQVAPAPAQQTLL